MPVLVTGGATPVGRAAVDALLRGGGEVRVFDDPARLAPVADALRRRGCKVARGTLDDEGHLELALEQVHTVVHLDAGLLRDPADLLDDLASVVSAAIGAGCRRLVATSHLHADEPRGNPWLEACREVEHLLADAPLETVVLRHGIVYAAHDPLTEALAARPDQRVADALHAPVWADDLAAVIAGADRMREGDVAREAPLALTMAVIGPDVVRLRDLAVQLPPPAAGGAGRGRRRLPEHVLDVLARDAVPASATRTPTPLRDGLARLRSEASAAAAP